VFSRSDCEEHFRVIDLGNRVVVEAVDELEPVELVLDRLDDPRVAMPSPATAIPEPKSRNTFPSTSSMNTPSDFHPTRGEVLLNDWERDLLSLSMISRAFGPGGGVTIFGWVYAIECLLMDDERSGLTTLQQKLSHNKPCWSIPGPEEIDRGGISSYSFRVKPFDNTEKRIYYGIRSWSDRPTSYQ
jgi:hypothetical protein